MSTRRIGAGIATLVLAGLLATPALAEPGVSATTIKIGMFGPLTGPVSVYGYPINNGAIAIYNEINAKGGINGRKLEIVHEDGACDPAKTRAAVKKLISRDEVFLIHGGSCSAAVFAAREEFVEEKVPFMVMAATMDKISDPMDKYIFTTTLPGSGDGRVMLDFIKTIPGVKRLAVVRNKNEWADAKLEKFNANYKAAGLEVIADVELARNATDATTQALAVKQANPDATLLVTYPGESAVFLRDALKYGLKGPYIGTNGIMDVLDLKDRAGGAEAVKDVYVSAFLKGPIGSPEMKEWTDIYVKQFPNDKLQSLSFYGMSGALTVVAALEKAGKDLTREKFIAALESINKGNAGPAFCEVQFAKDRRQGCLDGTMWTLSADGNTIVNLGPSWKKIK
ncbi:MAG: hypothetical protein EXQ96_00405 [Alphaproteobacteria bacterium]|nr:hypothetical protein [Alphaproteobacteria bacterium]